MKIYLDSTTNLGDFLNSLPVLSGLRAKFGPIEFIIRTGLKKFRGIKEFLMYQELFSNVYFDNEIDIGESIRLRSWSPNWDRRDQNNPDRPIETCRYENWLIDHYNLEFEVDDEFILQVADCAVEIKDIIYGGDRWSGHNIDTRRKSWTLKHLSGIEFLNYNNDIMTNAYIIKNSKNPFVSTFTGISVIADLLNKLQFVLYGPDIEYWDHQPIVYSFAKHFYKNRNSSLISISEFEKNIYGTNRV